MIAMKRQALAIIVSTLCFLTMVGTFTLCAAQDSWVSKAGMPSGRSGLGVAVVDGKIYAVGGASDSGFCSFNEQYDPSSGYWTNKTSMPTPRSAFGIAVFQNKIYCIGGYYAINNQGGATGVNEVYDPATDTWETKAPMPTPELNIQANVADGKIYVIGGNTNGTFNQVYDPATNSWTTKASIPTAVNSYASTAVGNKIYIFTSNLTQIYNAENDSWSLGTPAPSPVILAAAGATTGLLAPERIYVFGANAQQPFWQLTTKGFITQSYNPQTDSWTACASIPTGRYDAGVAVVDDLLYVIGGFTTQFSNVGFNPNPTYTYSTLNQQYIPIGYGTVPLKISIISPENKTYISGNISLAFTINKPVDLQGYTVDGQEKVSITGNTTLSELPSGSHNITVYATDSFGNTAFSQTITFSIAKPQTSIVTVAAVSVAVAVAVVAGLLVYFKKRKHIG
jgi:N-acetylneuraminic acid mutarotase